MGCDYMEVWLYPDLNLKEIDKNLDETEKENIVITLFFILYLIL